MNEENILEVKDLHVDIHMTEGLLTAVRGVNFEMKKGETLGLVGESGCGKSLTCKAILGINDKKCVPGGQILFDSEGLGRIDLLSLDQKGQEIRSIRGKEISMIFQEPMVAFSPMYTIGNQINEATRLHITRDKKKSKEISMEVMRKVGIANVEKRYNQYPHEFSGGMLQRALIAMALVCNHKMLIADEPTTALGVVAKMCDRVAVMYLGKIVESADAMEIYKNPQHPYTRGLIGSVHKIGSRKEERLFSIEGTVPLAMNLPKACGFYDRCDVRIEGLCDRAEPDLVEIAPGHKIACFNCPHEACRAQRAKAEAALAGAGPAEGSRIKAAPGKKAKTKMAFGKSGNKEGGRK